MTFRRPTQLLIFSLLILSSSFAFAADSDPNIARSEPGLWARRAAKEADWRRQGLSLVPYRTNYFFPFTYNTTPHPTTNNDAQHKEAKYQFSFKVLLADHFFAPYAHLFFAYTQLSMWQVYDRERSAPFRDINHEPELIVSLDTERDIRGIMLRRTEFGVVHQSNGAGPGDSRSWNRVYANFLFDHKNIALGFKPWVRLASLDNDDNPDIGRYMGYGEITLSYFRKNHVLSAMIRNNLRFNRNRGAFEMDYSFPISRTLTGLVQYFTGYGESLIDYNRPNNRFSIGLALSNF